MKQKIKHGALVALCALALVACFDDKGNYDYSALPDFYVDTTGIGIIPLHSQFDTLRLNSRLVYDNNREDLEFSWTIYLREAPISGNPATLLATTENLVEPITVYPSRYWIEFRATEPITGRSAIQRYPITVESSGSGLLVLYERDGLVDCDLIKTKLLTGALASDEVRRSMYTLANPDHPLTGSPVAVDMINYSNVQRFISIYTSDDGVKLSPDDMSVRDNFNGLFLFAPRTPRPQGYTVPYGVLMANPGETGDGLEILVSDGVCYANMIVFASLTGGGLAVYSERLSTAGDYYAAPYSFLGFGQIVVYDQLGRRFLSGPTYTTTLAAVVGSGDKFNFSNIGKDLVYLSYGFKDQYYIYAIFKNPVDNGERFLYVMNFYGGPTAVAAWDISSDTGIADANLFTFGRRGPTAFYASDNKVYRIPFDLDADSVAPAGEAWSAPAGEEITCLELCNYAGRDVQENTRDRYLFVGTYNAAGEGKLYIVQMNVTTGACVQEPVATFDQFGKIKDVAFKF
ncbi:MAG: hypothetical protein LBK12_03060 [Odoribacteraceae bacterium]|jgi:hypothetical protein|nr:hypothetical protein [Odoribacteraceae bacterium]